MNKYDHHYFLSIHVDVCNKFTNIFSSIVWKQKRSPEDIQLIQIKHVSAVTGADEL